MKKTLLMFLSVLLFCGFTFGKKIEPKYEQNIDLIPTLQSNSFKENVAWVGTFQLVFNDMKNEIIKNNIYFKNEKPSLDLIALNQDLFTKDMLNDSTYYTSYGETSPEAKALIEKAIFEKFNTKSDILESLDWSKREGKYYTYAMLKKDFDFIKPFDKLGKMHFNNSKESYDFFGIKKNSKKELKENVQVLFYNDENDYAVKLLTTNNDTLLLYRNNNQQTLEKIYNELMKKSNNFDGNRDFTKKDTLKIPNIKFNVLKKFETLCNKEIEGTNILFSDAIETLQFELNEKGGKVKSEAALIAKTTALRPQTNLQIRNFNFDKPFTLFLMDSGKEDPYMALKVNNLNTLK